MSLYHLKICTILVLSSLAFLPPLILFWNRSPKPTKEKIIHECNIPIMNPFDISIMPFHNRIKIRCKNPTVHLVKSDFEHLMLSKEPFLKMNQLNCCYRPYLKVGNMLSERSFANYCISINEKVKVKHEFVKIECTYGTHVVYMDYADFVLPVAKFPPVKKLSNHLNVILFILDGVSRMAFHRQLPETMKILNKIGVVEFTKFMKIGDNSFPNVMALLNGYGNDHLDRNFCWKSNLKTFDNCPFIWKSFEEKGFLTAFVEDAGHTDTFDFEKSGFLYQPVDYYWRPFNLLLTRSKTEPQNAKTPFVPACVGDTPVYVRFLNYTRNFFKRMQREQQKFFAFLHCNSASHDDNSLLASIDEELGDLFSELQRSGILKKTAVFFLSDHGSRYGAIRRTHQGYFEANLPFFFAYLPDQFRNKYISAFSAFKQNSAALTTVFDVHETLNDIVHMTFGKTKRYNPGISLFREIPRERTCADAGIPVEFCVCAIDHVIIKDHLLRITVGQTVVNEVNEFVHAFPECATLALNKVLDARYIKYWSHHTYLYQLKVTVSTIPGTGIFEGIIRQIDEKYVVLGMVSRLSTYGKESSCVRNTTLKLYCYCQS